MKCCERKTIRTDEDKKIIKNRLNRIQGQINGISNIKLNTSPIKTPIITSLYLFNPCNVFTKIE